jgi:hypothetical protein
MTVGSSPKVARNRDAEIFVLAGREVAISNPGK